MRTAMRTLIASLTLTLSLGAFAQPAKDATPPATPKQPAEKPKDPAKPAEQPKPTDQKPQAQAEEALAYVTFKTTAGDFVLELNREKAPITVKNFLSYVDKGHYSGTIFHRVISGFMIQGGGFTKDNKQKATDPPIKNEWQNGLKNLKHTISMARTGVVDSATSQFFINVVDNPGLDGNEARGIAGYAVFGKVVDGFDTIETIRNGKVGPNPANPREVSSPVSPVEVTEAKRLTAEEVSKLREKLTPKPATPSEEKK